MIKKGDKGKIKQSSSRITGKTNTDRQRNSMASESFYETLLSALDQIIIVTDAEGRILYLNKAAEDFYGYSSEEAIEKKVTDIILSFPEDTDTSEMLNRLKEGNPWSGNLKARNKNKDEVYSEFIAKPILDEQGELKEIIGIFRPEVREEEKIKSQNKKLRARNTILTSNSEKIREKHDELEKQFKLVMKDISSRKEVEKKIRESNTRLDDIIKHSSDMHYIHDLNNRLLFVSPQSESILGYSPDELFIKWTNLLSDHPGNEAGIKSTEEAVKTGKKQPIYTLELIRKDGERIWVQIDESPLKDKKGKVTGMVGALRDITAEKKAAALLSESNERLKLAMEAANEGKWEYHPHTDTFILDEKTSLLFGYDPDPPEHSRSWIAGLIHPDQREEVIRGFNDYLSGKTDYFQYEYQIKHYYGHYLWVSCHAKIIKHQTDGKEKIMVGMLRDVTERKHNELALAENERRIRFINNTVNDIVWQMDKNLVFKYISPSVERIMGYSPEEMVGTKVTDYLAPGSTKLLLETFRKKTSEKGQVPHDYVEYEMIGKRKNRVYVEVSSSPVFNDKGELEGLSGVSRDITTRKKVERALMESEARYRRLILNMNELICEIDENGVFTYANDLYDPHLGFKPDELVGYPAADFIHPEDFQLSQIKFGQLLETPGSSSDIWRFRHKKGNYLIFECKATSYKDEKGNSRIVVVSSDITQRIKTEIDLHSSRNNLLRAEEVAGFGHWELNLKNNEVTGSEGAKKIYGIHEESLSYELIKNLPLKEYRKFLDKAITDLIKYNKPYDVEFRIKKKDTGEIADIHSVAELDVKGEKIFGIINDITSRKNAERVLKQSEERFRNIIEFNATPMIIIDTEKDNVQFNSKFTEIFGYENKDLTDENSWWEQAFRDETVRIDAKKKWKKATNKARRTYGDIDRQTFSIYNKNGKEKIVEFNFVSLGALNIISMFDLTEIRKTEKARFENEEKLRLTVKAAKLGLYDVDLKAGKSKVSEEYALMLGYDPKDFSMDMQKWQKLLHPEDKEHVLEYYDRYIKGEQDEYRIEFRMKTASGKWCWILSQGETVEYDAEGRPKRMLGTHTDISRLKEYEMELERKNQEIASQNEEYLAINEELQASLEEIRETNIKLEEAKEKAEESDRLKSAFLANMSHEIRTPMNSILGFSDLLTQRKLPEEKRQKFSRLINHSGEQLMRLINDIIDISKIESNQLEIDLTWCDINNLLTEIAESQQMNKLLEENDELELKLNVKPGENPQIFTDPQRLTQILDNLLNNAIKFTPRGVVEMGYEKQEENGIKMIRFYVKDSGVGIPEKSQGEIFKRFVQADNQDLKSGTGLGLSITKGLVELLGGKIWLSSESGKGTTFFFTLPYHKGIRTHHEQEKNIYPEGSSDFRNKLIYVAEDDSGSYLYLNELLGETGATLVHLKNGEELIQETEKRKPDLILLDIKMPELSGIEAARQLKKKYPDLPIIAQTAYAMADERETCLKAGCNAYVSKPIRRDLLMQQILELMA